ncbi:hypothetical protein [Methylococcus mesophilus]|uniref:hypothetical protein n=1 Tax=Methylococcus mesophilus TaxID=2993564 RepID=UPI00224B656F|nr:hypothetical protein [Methylococcus mesophilus]UZR29087.1 hypothetical protein OOT43_00240 [Methylococcus mesophilus]
MNPILRWALWFVVQAASGITKEQWGLIQNKVAELETRAIRGIVDKTELNEIKKKEAAAYIGTFVSGVRTNVVHFVIEAALWFVRSFAKTGG